MKPGVIHIAICFFGLSFLIGACSKDSGPDCFKSTGEIKKESRFVAPFHYLEVHDNINLIFTQDTLINSLEVEAGENLLPKITTRVENGHLLIQNENSCNWARSFEVPISVYISFSRLDTIVFRAAGDLTFTNTWQCDSMQFDVWEGAGNIDLKLDVLKSRVYVHYGVVSVELSGWSQVSYISSNGYGPLDALGLDTKFTYLSTMSPNDCFITVEHELGVTIDNIGNVYYQGKS